MLRKVHVLDVLEVGGDFCDEICFKAYLKEHHKMWKIPSELQKTARKFALTVGLRGKLPFWMGLTWIW